MTSRAGKLAYYLKQGELKYLISFAKNKGFKQTVNYFLNAFRELMRETDYYGALDREIQGYKRDHPNHFRKAALHMMWWNFKRLFKSNALDTSASISLPEDKINVMFLPNGGLGDYIVIANYVYFFRQKFKNTPMRIDIVAKENFLGPTKAVFVAEGESPVDGIYDHSYSENMKQYDLVIDISRYPVVLHSNISRLWAIDYHVANYVGLCEDFRHEHPLLIDERPFHDGEAAKLCISEGRTRIKQPDIYDYLGVTEEYRYPILVPDKGEVFAKFGINSENYISVHRGCDTDYSKDSTKLWAVERYQKLIDLIKEKYPDIQIVQMGVSHSRCVSFSGVDVNLIEKTSINDLKVILKYARLHIDCEGGMVHLRHAMHGGPSVVIFGPTPVDFYKYSENINITSGGCPTWCEWAASDWTEKCVRGHKNPPCTYATTPEYVMEKIASVLDAQD